MKRKGYKLEDVVSLILRHCLGESNGEEEEAYQRMIRKTGVSFAQEEVRDALKRDVVADERREKAYRMFLRHIRKGRIERRIYPRVWAAVIVLVVGIGIALLHVKQDERMRVGEKTEELVVESKAYLTLSNGVRVDLTEEGEQAFWEKEHIAKCDSGTLVYATNGVEKHGETEKLQYNRVTVPRGGDFKLVLSDGSQVWLNSDSELKYPVDFEGDKREVYMSGEVYFDVAHQNGRPFVVHTSRGKIEVTGTEFNVRDYKEEKIVETTLVEGSVIYHSAYRQGKKGVLMLEPGEQSVDTEGEVMKREVDVENVVSWKNGMYYFRDKSLEELMRYVERTYDVHVFFTNESIKQLRFSGDLQRYVRVELFLRYLEQGGDVRFEVRGRSITVYKK